MTIVLVGCNKNLIDTGNNGTLENEKNQEMNDTLPENKMNEEKYRLSDTYYISGEKLDINKAIINFFSDNTDYKEHYYIESDGTKFDISCNLIKNENENEFQTWDVKINDETLELSTNIVESVGDVFGSRGCHVGNRFR